MDYRRTRFIGGLGLLLVVLAFVSLAGARGTTPPGEEVTALFERLHITRPAPAPDRPPGEGKGPFARLVLRGGTLIDGTGAPPIGPVDIVVEGGRIKEVRNVGAPGLAINPRARPAPGDFELDVSGMYILPGFIDSHAHTGNVLQGLTGPIPPPEYIFKLWLAHGVTTIREVGAGMGLGWTLGHKRRAAAGEITAPRHFVYVVFPSPPRSNVITTPKQAREWIRAVKARGADGIKFFGGPPAIIRAALEEAGKLGLGTAFHHDQMAVARMNVLDTASWGLDSMEHWYGLPEALFEARTIQDYPADYNFANEQDRFGQAGRLWRQAAAPESAKWNAVIDELIGLDFTIDPTLTIYSANRDVMRARNADWMADYALPGLFRFFEPNRKTHGAYFYDWTTADEIAWKDNFRLWMRFLNDYKNRGGRVVTGSDSGFIYQVFGFGYIQELELLQEAGFHPLEVIRAATLNGAELLGVADDLGSVEVGKRADFVIVKENPLRNFKVLYGTGHMKLDDKTGKVVRVGGVRWTIKDGIIFDARKLRADVREMVRAAKAREARDAK